MIYIIGNDGTPQRVDGVGNELYPVGSIYMSTENTSPASMFGGTWEQIKDRFLLSAGDTYSAGATGGEASHMLAQNEMARIRLLASEQPGNDEGMILSSSIWTKGDGSSYTIVDMAKGFEQTAFSLMPPYLVVYCWKRIS